jgi:hypothetical protein
LERITGRHGDRVVRPDGETLSVLGFVWVFHCLNEVHRWQVVQTSPTALKVRYDAPEWFDPRPLEERLRSLCGSAMTITLAPSEPIEQTPHGKHPVVIVDEAATAGLAGSQRR